MTDYLRKCIELHSLITLIDHQALNYGDKESPSEVDSKFDTDYPSEVL